MSALADILVPTAQANWEPPLDQMSRIHFYHTDHLGSTRLVTEADGDIFERIDYLPFGEIFTDDVTADPDALSYDKHRHKYTGQMWDYLTGLYYYGARYYDPEIGRFTQADTVVPEPLDGQTFNRYSYCFNNPYKYVDPSGHNPLEEFFIGLAEAIFVGICTVIGAVVGFFASGFNPAGMAAGAALGYMLGSGIVGGIESARKGGDFGSGFMIGVAMSAVTLACPELAIPGLGFSVYNLINKNDSDAWGYFLGSLVGGILSPSPSDFDYETGGVLAKSNDNPGEMTHSQIEKASIPIEGSAWENDWATTLGTLYVWAEKIPGDWDTRILNEGLAAVKGIYVYPGSIKDMPAVAWFNPVSGKLYLSTSSVNNPFTVFHEIAHAFQVNYSYDPVVGATFYAGRESFAKYCEYRMMADSAYYNLSTTKQSIQGYVSLHDKNIGIANQQGGLRGRAAFYYFFGDGN